MENLEKILGFEAEVNKAYVSLAIPLVQCGQDPLQRPNQLCCDRSTAMIAEWPLYKKEDRKRMTLSHQIRRVRAAFTSNRI